jgi:hypothetical protein
MCLHGQGEDGGWLALTSGDITAVFLSVLRGLESVCRSLCSFAPGRNSLPTVSIQVS